MLQSTKGNIAIGGRIDVDNKFLEPTVITGVDKEDSTMQVARQICPWLDGQINRLVLVYETNKFLEPTVIIGDDKEDSTMQVARKICPWLDV